MKKKNSAPRPAESSCPAPAAGERFWPEEFARPRTALLIAASVLLFSALLFGLAYAGRLYGVKMALAWAIGLADPARISIVGYDLAAVLSFLALILGAGLVHPSLGIIVIALLRPWHDGYTHPNDNMYFLWAIWILFALWALRVIFRGEPIRGGRLTSLLGLFLAAATIGIVSAFQFDVTYRNLLLWFGYLTLFLLTCNTVRSRRVMGILVAGIVVSFALETLFSIVQFHYMLALLRQMVRDPAILQKYFHTDVITPDLARRFNVNRAFGSMLFPNALAGFLILGIPLAAMGTWSAWQRLLPAWRVSDGGGKGLEVRYRAAAAAVAVWFVVTLVLFTFSSLASVYASMDQEVPYDRILFGIGGSSMLAALLPAVLTYWVAYNRGLTVCGMFIRAAVFSLLFPLECYALWVTYSRGGMLCLALAVVMTALLWRLDESKVAWIARRCSRGAAAAVVILCLVLLLGFLTPGLSAQEKAGTAKAPEAPATVAPRPASASAPQAPGAEVTNQGINLGAADLLDPSSLGLRFTYWRVALRMFAAHFWTGVGLGNFGIAYPMYQYVGAGDVRLAHNGFLQACCETGILGGLLLLAFWGYFLLWGAWRILGETDRPTRFLLAGLYAGILAFLLHACIDIHFSHPSLLMFVMILAGAFYAGAALSQPMPSKASATLSQMAALALLVLVALAVGMGLRIYRQDLALARLNFLELTVKSEEQTMRRFHVAQFFIRDVREHELRNASGKARKGKLNIPYMAALDLFADQETLAKVGNIYVPLPDTPRGVRKLALGETIPQNAILLIERPWDAAKWAQDASLRWLQSLEETDACFPHNAELAVHLASWYSFLAERARGEKFADLRRESLDKFLFWAKEALHRSPMHPDMHANYAQALWTMANEEKTEKRLDWLAQALTEFREAARLTPASAVNIKQCADALRETGESYRKFGKTVEADACAKEAESLEKDAEKITSERKELHID